LDAVILAGGKGERLRPYTAVVPKPLLPIGDSSVLEIVLRQLARSGFTRVTLAVSHRAELIQSVCEDGRQFGIDIRYSHEDEPLSTAGPLRLIRDLGDPCLVINGDVLTSLDYRALVDFHRRAGAAATIAVQHRNVPLELGVIERHPDGTLRDYIEKPEVRHLVAMGVNVFDPRVFSTIAAGEALEMPSFLLRLMRAGEKVLTYESDCLWLHLSRRDDYEQAVSGFERYRDELLPP
jgi:NDP-sugar pyrophosphorylase family protein